MDINYILLEKNLWSITENQEKFHIKSTSVNDSAIETFKAISNDALSVIYLNVGVDYKKIIEDCKDPVEEWKRLKSNYCPDPCSHHVKEYFLNWLSAR